MRFAFAAAVFGESSEALFWLQLSRALNHLMRKLVNRPPQKSAELAADSELDDRSILSRITSKGKSVPGTGKKDPLVSHITVKSLQTASRFNMLFTY